MSATPASGAGAIRRRHRMIGPTTAAIVLVAFAAVAVGEGLPVPALLRALAAIALTQVLPGAILWRLVRPVHGWWLEDGVLGAAIGSALAVATQAVGGSVGFASLSWLPLALGLAVLAHPAGRARLGSRTTTRLPAWWGPSVAAGCLLLLGQAAAFYRTLPLAWTGFRAQYVDMTFHLAVAGQIAHRGPAEIPFVLGEPLRYHWFSHAWVAQVANAGAVDLDVVLFRILPVFVSLAVVAAVAIAAVRLSGRAWAGPAAAVLAVAAGDLNVFSGATATSLVNHLSPSLGFSNLVVTALLVVVVLRWRDELGGRSYWLMVLLALAAAGSKGSALAVVVGGAVVCAVAAWASRHPARWRVSGDTIALAAVFVGAYMVLFGGGGDQLAVAPVDALAASATAGSLLPTPEDASTGAIAVAGVLALLGALARGAGAIPAMSIPSPRRPIGLSMLLGTGLAGAAALVLLSHPGRSQTYFLRNAVPALAIASAIGLVAGVAQGGRRGWHGLGVGLGTGVAATFALRRFPDPPWIDPPVTAAVARSLVLAVVLVVGATVAWRLGHGSGRRTLALVAVGTALCTVTVVPTLGPRIVPDLPDRPPALEPDGRRAFSDDQVSAARWLRDHSDPRAVVATNRHCGVAQWTRCDSRRFYVSAYTERQVLVEGWAYTQSWIRTPDVEQGRAYKPFWDEALLELNDEFLTDPTPETARAMWDLGVRWVYVDKTVEHAPDLSDHGRLRHETEWARVLELVDPSTAPRASAVTGMSQAAG